AHGAAGRADSEINVVCRGPVNGDVIALRLEHFLTSRRVSLRCPHDSAIPHTFSHVRYRLSTTTHDVNPYTPPETNTDAKSSRHTDTRRRFARSVRTFAIAVFAGLFMTGPSISTTPIKTLAGVSLFGLLAVWFDRTYSR
ncbi:hypothetical protein, partial [Novipirellula herctigrandis]|uniref:hypothetical protein n=1 Tax=Novipirellula herctigrandis TaxID=2527986 RepID=UPI003AF3BCD9